jgi:hypothetical protein
VPTWKADKDAWVYESNPTLNTGLSTQITAGYPFTGGADEADTYLHFDLSSIPLTATVVSAELYLYLFQETHNFYPTGYSLEDVNTTWVENTITWSNKPATTWICAFDGPAEGFVGWYKITDPALTALVQVWVDDPSVNNGLAIKPEASIISDDQLYLYSREDSSGNAPKLAVRYSP